MKQSVQIHSNPEIVAIFLYLILDLINLASTGYRTFPAMKL